MLKLNGQGLIASPMASTPGELQGGGNGHWNMHHTCIWDVEATTALQVSVPANASFQYKQALDFQLLSPTLAWDLGPTSYAPQPKYGVGLVKREEYYSAGGGGGFNIWQRTYFSLDNALAVERMLATSRGLYSLMRRVVPRCQAEGCGVDLSCAKLYHRRHKVCEFHAKAIVATVAGLDQRFCQQCRRLHVLPDFDEAKRSCRKRLAGHNRRRRKPPPPPAAASKKKTTGTNSSSKNKNSKANMPRSPVPSRIRPGPRAPASAQQCPRKSLEQLLQLVEETGTVRTPNASTKQKQNCRSIALTATATFSSCLP